MNDIEKIHHIAMNPLDCNIHHEEGDTLTVQRVKALAYVVRSQGQQLADTQRKLEAAGPVPAAFLFGEAADGGV